MEDPKIRRPKKGDVQPLHQFFENVIVDTFAKEGISHLTKDLQEEIQSKKKFLQTDLDSGGEHHHFLIATINNEIVGTITSGPANELIDSCSNGQLRGYVEVGTVFVLPEYQGRGIGNFMLTNMYQTLQEKGIHEFCLDSGYKIAQKIWTKKFGQPLYLMENYWGEGNHHMIWKLSVDDVTISC